MAGVNKVDANATGLRVAEELSFKVLPGSPVWLPMEPNEYDDFGGAVVTTSRNPINASRMPKKGLVTDLDASGGFTFDVTQTSLQELWEGVMFADFRSKNDVGDDRQARRAGVIGEFEDYLITGITTATDTITVDSRVALSAVVVIAGTGYAVGDVVEVTDANATVLARFIVTGETGGLVDTVALTLANFTGGLEGRTDTDTGAGAATTKITGSGDDALTLTLTYGNGLVWGAGDIVRMQGNDDAGNNGNFVLASVADNILTTVENLVLDATPNAAATLTTVGFQCDANDVDVDVAGTFPALTSTTTDFTDLGVIPGEWVYIGGELAASFFDTAANNGFKRVRTVVAARLEFDKSDLAMVVETGADETIEIYLGRVLKNENDTSGLIRRRSYQLERTLGAPDSLLPAEVQAEYIEGAVPSEATITIPSASKMTANLSFIGGDSSTIDGPTSLKTGTRPAVNESDAYNTSSDFSRIRLAVHVDGTEAPTPLFAFAQNLEITFNENLTPNKAISVLGSFEISHGTLNIGGSITAYFANVASINAVRNNSNVTLDFACVKGAAGSKAGFVLDLPLITLGDARLNVVQDQAITLPLDMDAATAALIDPNLDYVASFVFFDFLPDSADT